MRLFALHAGALLLVLTGTVIAAPAAQEPGGLIGYFGPTRVGDTLWNIAERLQRGSDASVVRIHRRLIRDNPEAFIDGDPNRLRLNVELAVRGPKAMAALGWTGPTERMRAAPGSVARSTRTVAAPEAEAEAGRDDMAASDADKDAFENSMAASATAGPDAEYDDDMAASHAGHDAFENSMAASTAAGPDAEHDDDMAASHAGHDAFENSMAASAAAKRGDGKGAREETQDVSVRADDMASSTQAFIRETGETAETQRQQR